MRATFFVLALSVMAVASCEEPTAPDLQCNGLGIAPLEFSDEGNPPMILQNRYTVPNRAGGVNGDCMTLYDSLGFRN